jgi:aminoglycoside phosphotransferase (APT) family kinase protein
VVRVRRGDVGDDRLIEIESAALRAAVDAGVPAPTLIGADPTGDVAGRPAIASTRLSGTSDVPTTATPARLRALGRAVGRLSTAAADPAWSLPRRDRPLADVAFAIGTDGPAAELRSAATERLAARPPAAGDLVLVHGDCWQGNTMWRGDVLVGFIDWDAAGIGPAGIDLSGMRLDAALYFGADAADAVTAGWADAVGAVPIDLAGWDLVASLATPADLGEWIDIIRCVGRPDLDVATTSARRDEFTRRALATR